MRDVKGENYIQNWLDKCLPETAVTFCHASNIKFCDEREVWDCTFSTGGAPSAAVLKIFKPGSLQSVNTSLPPNLAAEKCSLAMVELRSIGIPTPRVLGHTEIDDQAALLCEKIERISWDPSARIKAAGVLARLHNLSRDRLSEGLQKLADISDPREYRTTEGRAPKTESKTLVHGDYFSANILTTADGLYIIDWETFGWGDPMWDLGFLVGADRSLPEDEVCATVDEYEKEAPIHRERLLWHQRCWSDYWSKR